jgi:hypothetical protein
VRAILKDPKAQTLEPSTPDFWLLLLLLLLLLVHEQRLRCGPS